MKEILKKIIITILTFEARLLLKKRQPKIIAITGSVGKTSTKDAIYVAIKGHVHARKSQKSFNSEIGVPLSVLGLPNAWSSPYGWAKNIVDGFITALFPGDYPEWLVLEVGVDRPGDMARVTSWLTPDIVVLTRLPDMPVHVEFFESPEDVISEKLQLVEALKPEGTLIYNNDDERVRKVAKGARQSTVGYGRYSETDVHIEGDEVIHEEGRPIGISATFLHKGEKEKGRVSGALGVQTLYTLAASVAVAHVLGSSLHDTLEAFKNYLPPAGRMRIIEGVKGTIILDDSYNSSPVALERSLQTLRELKVKGRRVVVLGDMLELGRYSMDAHEAVGKRVARCADLLLTVGIRSRGIAEGALENGMNEKHIFQYESAERAGRELQTMLKEHDVVLVKGSQSIRLEKVIKEVMRHPEHAKELLVRQEGVWRGR